MIDLKYSLVIEATDDPSFFGSIRRNLKGSPGSVTLLKVVFTKQDGGWKSTSLADLQAQIISDLPRNLSAH
jgi:hypothetical protein